MEVLASPQCLGAESACIGMSPVTDGMQGGEPVDGTQGILHRHVVIGCVPFVMALRTEQDYTGALSHMSLQRSRAI